MAMSNFEKNRIATAAAEKALSESHEGRTLNHLFDSASKEEYRALDAEFDAFYDAEYEKL